MISLIICSINPQRVENIRRNVEQTIGMEFELLVRDNRGKSDGICRVYNELASQAKGDFLCFMHEDIMFDTQNWGEILCQQAQKPECGVVGFSGAALKTQSLSGAHHRYYEEANVADIIEGSEIPANYRQLTCSSQTMAPVVTVDGVLMLVRREVYDRVNGYDEDTFKGFHLYDLDFSTAVFDAGYTNYICHNIRFAHFSLGCYTQEWYDDTVKYHEKWGAKLPLYVSRPSDKIIQRDEKYIHFNITYHLMKRSLIDVEEIAKRVRWQLKHYPMFHKSWDHYRMFLKYRRNYKQVKQN